MRRHTKEISAWLSTGAVTLDVKGRTVKIFPSSNDIVDCKKCPQIDWKYGIQVQRQKSLHVLPIVLLSGSSVREDWVICFPEGKSDGFMGVLTTSYQLIGGNRRLTRDVVCNLL